MSTKHIIIPEAVLRELAAKYSFTAIARMHNCCDSVVGGLAKKYGIKARLKAARITPEELEYIHRRVREGAPCNRIAIELKRSHSFVLTHISTLQNSPVVLPSDGQIVEISVKWPEYDRANEALIARAGGYGPRREQPCRSSSGGI